MYLFFYMVLGLYDFYGGKYLLWPLEGVGPENIDFFSTNGPLRSLLFQVLGGGGVEGAKPLLWLLEGALKISTFLSQIKFFSLVAISGPKKASAIIPLQLSFYYYLALFVNNLRRLVNVNN